MCRLVLERYRESSVYERDGIEVAGAVALLSQAAFRRQLLLISEALCLLSTYITCPSIIQFSYFTNVMVLTY